MELIQSLIAIPEAAAQKQARQISGTTTAPAKLLTSAPASNTVQFLLFKKLNEPVQISEQNDAADLKAV